MSLNDKAWRTIFDRLHIIEEVNKRGSYVIAAKTIKEIGGREPRLMAKFDHRSQLPEVMKRNRISILPISRTHYVLGEFDIYQPVEYETQQPIPVDLPDHVTTIDTANLYSESAALHCAMVTGMLEDAAGESVLQTVSGRMSSKEFQFEVRTQSGESVPMHIRNAQIEIDGGYEGCNRFMLVEAKKEAVDDFLIRQLYYPYRLWRERTQKPVIPLFFTLSNDVFSFFTYEFSDPLRLNSIRLVEQRDYILRHEAITLPDLLAVYHGAVRVPEPRVPFPQADSFPRIVDLMSLLMGADLAKVEITSNYNFDSRQTNYYTAAGMYLGLLERYEEDSDTRDPENSGAVNSSKRSRRPESRGRQIKFRLSSRGRAAMKQSFKPKYLALAESILEHGVFAEVFQETQKQSMLLSRERVIQIMRQHDLYQVQSDSTYFRRASTVLRWIQWILDLCAS